jgi:hypothetical protein
MEKIEVVKIYLVEKESLQEYILYESENESTCVEKSFIWNNWQDVEGEVVPAGRYDCILYVKDADGNENFSHCPTFKWEYKVRGEGVGGEAEPVGWVYQSSEGNYGYEWTEEKTIDWETITGTNDYSWGLDTYFTHAGNYVPPIGCSAMILVNGWPKVISSSWLACLGGKGDGKIRLKRGDKVRLVVNGNGDKGSAWIRLHFMEKKEDVVWSDEVEYSKFARFKFSGETLSKKLEEVEFFAPRITPSNRIEYKMVKKEEFVWPEERRIRNDYYASINELSIEKIEGNDDYDNTEIV